jgi:hypothetical protein
MSQRRQHILHNAAIGTADLAFKALDAAEVLLNAIEQGTALSPETLANGRKDLAAGRMAAAKLKRELTQGAREWL